MVVVLPVIPYPAINPILISIGPFAVRWYALAYIVGIIAGWFYARALIASERLWGGQAPITVLDFDDFVIWITLGIILGGRTGYVLFYNLPLFAAHPVQIFELCLAGALARLWPAGLRESHCSSPNNSPSLAAGKASVRRDLQAQVGVGAGVTTRPWRVRPTKPILSRYGSTMSTSVSTSSLSGGGNRLDAGRAAAVDVDNRLQELPVQRVQAPLRRRPPS